MRLGIAGIGACGAGFGNWPELALLLAEGRVGGGEFSAPAARRIPDRERRRAPLLVRMAVEVADQAVTAAGLHAGMLRSVFASGMGDVQTTDQICRALASPARIVSPTQFHNSVHNAAAGYWSIAAVSRRASNSVSGFRNSLGIALLEAAASCRLDDEPCLLVAADIVTRPPLDAICAIRAPLAVALVLTPAPGPLGALELTVDAAEHDETPSAAWFEAFGDNPAARALPLLELLARQRAGAARLRVGRGSWLSMRSHPAAVAVA